MYGNLCNLGRGNNKDYKKYITSDICKTIEKITVKDEQLIN